MANGRRGRGEGSIHRRSDGLWVGTLDLGLQGGRRQRKSVYGKTQREVREKLRSLQRTVEAGAVPAPANLTVGRFLRIWLQEFLPGTVSPRTEDISRNIVEVVPRVRPWGNDRARASSPPPTSAGTGNDPRVPRLCTRDPPQGPRAVLRRALRRGEAGRDRYSQRGGHRRRPEGATPRGTNAHPGTGADLPPGRQGRPPGDGLHRGSRLGSAAGGATGYLLGRRETRRPDAARADPPPATASPERSGRPPTPQVRQAGAGGPCTCRSRSWKRSGEHTGPGRRGKSAGRRGRGATRRTWCSRPPLARRWIPRCRGKSVPRICKAAGLGHWSIHELRHSCASLLLAMGVPLEVVSDTLGHASIRVTMDVYGHLLAPAKMQAAEAMRRALLARGATDFDLLATGLAIDLLRTRLTSA